MTGPSSIQPDPLDLRGRTVLVLGLGDSGLAMARWLHGQGARLRVADTRLLEGVDLPGWRILHRLFPEVEAMPAPAWSEQWLDGVDRVAWSPGLSIEKGESAAFHARALARGIAVVGELQWFAWALAALREKGGAAEPASAGQVPRIVAVTGTNGKTTTSALTAHLVRAAGCTVACAGNIRPAMLDALREAIEANALPQVWVLELSSFQLALADRFVADAAVILNVADDHLDWHASAQSYRAAKQRIFAHAAAAVFPRGDASSAPPGAGPATRRISFGTDAPVDAGDFGVVDDDGIAWLAQAQAVEDPDAPRSARRRAPGTVRVQRLMPVEALRIRGAHNQRNALAALALYSALGLPMARALRALQTYAGEPHRCQPIATIDGVEYVDDSKGTNVAATVAALEGLGRRCRLILGGVGKGQDFSPLIEPVRAHAASVFLIGADAGRIRAALAASGVALVDCASLGEAVSRAAAEAVPGEIVLLSPACASFDMFRDYEHRGQCFANAVRALAANETVAAPPVASAGEAVPIATPSPGQAGEAVA